MRYLDPKNDLIFKRVFGEHPNIIKSFLNAMLPLDGRVITSLEYLPAELVPDLPTTIKNSAVDVRCIDNSGRQFLVEMQMLWTESFKSRVLFNASKAYIRQLHKGMEYKGLQPVYALSIVNEVFEKEMPQWYHHYSIVHIEDASKTIEGLQLIFVELPKLRVKNITEKKLSILWMRYLYELENFTEMISEDLLTVPEIAQAIELTKESSYTKAELEAYDKYWDSISTEKTFIADAEAKGEEIGMIKGEEIGMIKGEEIGMIKGEEIGMIKGEEMEKAKIILKLYAKGSEISFIADVVQKPEAYILEILTKNGHI
jgi:predicted transposase/invertase (TIGR01784 family)